MLDQTRQLTRSPQLFAFALVVLTVVLLTGCASSKGPEFLTVDASGYERAFNAAAEAARKQGMAPILQDRRSGVIETDSQIAATILEPWHNDNASYSQAVENTLSMQRRRARFEFVPAGFQPPEEKLEGTLAGPDVLAIDRPPFDLTKTQDQLHLRVWVYVERASTPGIRHGTWSRTETSQAILVVPEGQSAKAHGAFWTPVNRDPAFERRLLAQVEQSLGDVPASPE